MTRLTFFSLLLALSPIPTPTYAQFPSSFRVRLFPQELNTTSPWTGPAAPPAPNPKPPTISKAPTLISSNQPPPSAKFTPPAPVAWTPPPTSNIPLVPLFLFNTPTTHYLWTTAIPNLASVPAVSESAASNLFSTLVYESSAYNPNGPVPSAYSVSSGALVFALAIHAGTTIEWGELATFANDLLARAGNLEAAAGKQAGGAWYGSVTRLQVEIPPWMPSVPFELPPKIRRREVARRRQRERRSWETTGNVVAEWRVVLTSGVALTTGTS